MKTQQIQKESLTNYSSKKTNKKRAHGFDQSLLYLGVSQSALETNKKVA